MALHPSFPTDPYVVLDPDIRWFPAEETLRDQGYEKLLPRIWTTRARSTASSSGARMPTLSRRRCAITFSMSSRSSSRDTGQAHLQIL